MWRGLWGLRELHGRAGDDETDDARAEETMEAMIPIVTRTGYQVTFEST